MSGPPGGAPGRPPLGVGGAALLGLMALAATGCGAGAKNGGAGGAPSHHPIRLRLSAMDGGEIDLARYRGRVVVLHLFDTDSPAASLDAEELSTVWERHRDQVTIIGICLDREGYPMAAAWRRALGVRYLIALASATLREGNSPLGRLRVVPTTLLLDRSGQLVERIERALQPGELAQRIAALRE